MIGVDVLLTVIPGLPKDDLDRWIQNHWIRPDGHDGDYRFADIDVARVRLILELRDQLEINEAALPVVLLLLDQVYDLRRQLAAGVARLSPRD